MKAHVLIVDDRPENLLSIEAALGSLDIEVVKASSGTEALRHLLDRDFALAILDVQMPGLDGYETAALIRSRERLSYMPIIFLTAVLTSEPHIFKGYEAGAVDYLLKPIAPQILKSKVASFVELYRKSEEVKQQAEKLREIERREKERERERAEILDRLVQERTCELARTTRDLETMLYVATHDLKEPLNAIENFARILNEKYAPALDEKAQDFLRRIGRGTRRMRSLLDGLMAIARTRQIEVPDEKVSGHEVVMEVLARLAEKIRETGATVRVEGNLPELRAHRTWATEALANLVSNALKFPSPGEAPDIEIGPYDGPEGIGLTVLDRGPGVSPYMADRIFQLFQRGVGQEVEGTGAGLAIVRQIAERHGGEAIWRPRPDGGSEFVVTFGKQNRGLPPARILIVDNDEDFIFILKEMFAQSGTAVEVEVARNGEDALERLERRGAFSGARVPDLVLLDINIPRRTGFEVLEAMKADSLLRTIPTLMISTSNRPADRDRSLSAGADSFVTKAHGFDKIAEMVQKVLFGRMQSLHESGTADAVSPLRPPAYDAHTSEQAVADP
jgi:CheY-like chemotaxis protein